MQKITIYCDGACQGNPGKSGSGIAVYYTGEEKPVLYYGNHEEKGTNNSAELGALYAALKIASEANLGEEITILSDSKYSIDCITKWAYGWASKGWTKRGGPIKNLDLIKQAHSLYNTMKDSISIAHVKGHSGVEGNELADRMAGFAIKQKNVEYETYEYSSIREVLSL